MQYVHYTVFGIQYQPQEADRDGFLEFRDEFETLQPDLRTPAENLILECTNNIRKFQGLSFDMGEEM